MQEILPAQADQPELVLEDFIGNMVYGFKPPHPHTLRLSELVTYAAKNRSYDCLDELLRCIYRLAQTAFHKRNEKYFGDWVFQFYWSYHASAPHSGDAGFNTGPDIMRRMHWLGYHLLGRWLLQTPHLSLANILGGRRIVPELMPWHGSRRKVIEMVMEVMDDLGWLFETREALLAVSRPLRVPPPHTASDNAAALALRTAGR